MTSVNKSFEMAHADMDKYLSELAKELRREYGRHARFELVLVGGAAIACQYNFRQMTNNIDAISRQSIKQAVYQIAEKFSLPDNWLNTDFARTSSYSPKLWQYSKYYKTFSGLLTVRIISGEYLVAMKMASFRQYKRDRSDIVGILAENKKDGHPISLDDVKRAAIDLYGTNQIISQEALDFVSHVIGSGRLEELYEKTLEIEERAKYIVIAADRTMAPSEFQDNIDEIINEGLGYDNFISMLETLDDKA